MAKQKAVIKLGVSDAKHRSKAMQMASEFGGVSLVAITGDGKDRLEVVGEGLDIPCLVICLRKKVCRAANIVVVEEVKDKKKEEEEKKKKEEAEKKMKEEEAKKKAEEARKKAEEEYKKLYGVCPPPPPPPYYSGGYYHPMPMAAICEDQPAGCHIM